MLKSIKRNELPLDKKLRKRKICLMRQKCRNSEKEMQKLRKTKEMTFIKRKISQKRPSYILKPST